MGRAEATGHLWLSGRAALDGGEGSRAPWRCGPASEVSTNCLPSPASDPSGGIRFVKRKSGGGRGLDQAGNSRETEESRVKGRLEVTGNRGGLLTWGQRSAPCGAQSEPGAGS